MTGMAPAEVFMYVGLLVAVLVLLDTRAPGVWILSAACLSLLVGWRGLTLWGDSRMYAAEIFLWAGCLAAWAFPGPHRDFQKPGWPLIYPGLLLCSALVAAALALADDRDPVLILSQFKTFIVFAPALLLLYRFLRTVPDMMRVAEVLVVAGGIIALLGVAEYFYPPLASIAPVKVNTSEYYRMNFNTAEQIHLAGFNLWGTATVAAGLVPVLGVALGLAAGAAGWRRFGLYTAVGFLMAGILLSGYRSSWLGMLTAVAVLGIARRKRSLLILAAPVLFFLLLPGSFLDRFGTIWQGTQAGDTSLLHREEMIDYAWQAIAAAPVTGNGWAMFVTYNDWVALALALGLLGIVPFVLWYLTLLSRLIVLVRRFDENLAPRERGLALGFLAALAGNVVGMMSGAVTFVAPLLVSFWIIFCLAARTSDILVALTGHEKADGLAAAILAYRRTSPAEILQIHHGILP